MVFKKINFSLSDLFTKQRILRILKNKYVIATTVFILLILFIDDKNLIETGKAKNKLQELENEESDLRRKIKIQRNEIQELDKDKNIEKLAREKYLMKKEDEDLFIIKEKE